MRTTPADWLRPNRSELKVDKAGTWTLGPARRPNSMQRSQDVSGALTSMNNGIQIPQLGFGVFLIPAEETEKAVSEALSAGYRLIDTAQGYRNEEGVGAAIASAGIQRDELFITTKLTNSEQGYDKALRAFDESMNKLGIDVLDLFLIHWPQPMFDQYVETWRAFERLLADGRVCRSGSRTSKSSTWSGCSQRPT